MLIQKHHPQNTATLKLPTRDTATSASVCSPFNSQRSFILWEAYIFVFWPSLFWLCSAISHRTRRNYLATSPIAHFMAFPELPVLCTSTTPPPCCWLAGMTVSLLSFVIHLQSLGWVWRAPFFLFFSARTQNWQLAAQKEIYTEFDKKSVGLALMTIHLMIALRKLCAGTCRVFLLRFEYSVPITFKLNGKIEFAKCICERCM